MAGETSITIIGNLTSDPELRFTPNGAAVASFTVASTPRTYDKGSNEWKDGQALFLRCSLWRQPAENLAASNLAKGSRVIVQGRLKQRSFETREGEKRTVIELDVDEIGPSLRYATAQVARTERGEGGQNGGSRQARQQPSGPRSDGSASASDDPWSMAPGGYSGDEPPF
ncbi:single-stranded DNA-binding protein [Frankia sp. R43]|uniref:single-stranded DNA-binding protein n=1 Tax=Frankia sp. R43 TaxID=269536 RepID=UPI0006C9F13B|nr:single-stranded DNA-binding protein [Frankia sp. R43]KPM55653.1 single-stranded DNA-binding protein [Frankia sp. R43]